MMRRKRIKSYSFPCLSLFLLYIQLFLLLFYLFHFSSTFLISKGVTTSFFGFSFSAFHFEKSLNFFNFSFYLLFRIHLLHSSVTFTFRKDQLYILFFFSFFFLPVFFMAVTSKGESLLLLLLLLIISYSFSAFILPLRAIHFKRTIYMLLLMQLLAVFLHLLLLLLFRLIANSTPFHST